MKNFVKNLEQHDAAALITSPANIKYLSGFNSQDGLVLITAKKTYLLVDSRYYEDVKQQNLKCEIVLCEKKLDCLNKLFENQHIKKIYVENDHLTVDFFQKIQELDVNVISDDSLSKLLFQVRSVKTPSEIDKIKKSQEITDAAFFDILQKLKPGMSEKQIATEIEFFMRRNGAEKVAFDFVVASGERTRFPHATPTDRVIQNGDLLTLDIGAVFEGYHSDMTRTIAVGNINDYQKEIYNLVLEAQLAAIKIIKPGVFSKDVQEQAQCVISDAGYQHGIKHGLGHGIGLQIHEPVYINSKDQYTLTAGMVFSIEPGIYVDDFGVRIEDLICVTSDGCVNLTFSNKKLINI